LGKCFIDLAGTHFGVAWNYITAMPQMPPRRINVQVLARSQSPSVQILCDLLNVDDGPSIHVNPEKNLYAVIEG
jgi:hypothetical protein